MTKKPLRDILLTMLTPTLDFHLQPNTVNDGVTQSELSMKDECSLKWNFRYNNRLNKADYFDWNLFVGASWHEFQQIWRESKGVCDVTKLIIPANVNFNRAIRNSEFEEELEYWTYVLPAYQEAYALLYKEEAKHEWLLVEKELTAEWEGFKVRGKIDLMSESPRFIRDFKTTSSAWLTSPDGWHFKLQFMLYCWLVWKSYPEWAAKPFQFQLDMMQKPGLKQTKADATLAGHIRRVVADVKARAADFYLKRTPHQIFPENIKRFEETVLTPKLRALALVQDNPEETLPLITNPNTNACNAYGKRCEFYDICDKGWDYGKHFFLQRDQKHEEL